MFVSGFFTFLVFLFPFCQHEKHHGNGRASIIGAEIIDEYGLRVCCMCVCCLSPHGIHKKIYVYIPALLLVDVERITDLISANIR